MPKDLTLLTKASKLFAPNYVSLVPKSLSNSILNPNLHKASYSHKLSRSNLDYDVYKFNKKAMLIDENGEFVDSKTRTHMHGFLEYPTGDTMLINTYTSNPQPEKFLSKGLGEGLITDIKSKVQQHVAVIKNPLLIETKKSLISIPESEEFFKDKIKLNAIDSELINNDVLLKAAKRVAEFEFTSDFHTNANIHGTDKKSRAMRRIVQEQAREHFKSLDSDKSHIIKVIK